MQARMGKRLDFSLDLPDALAPLQVPSMLVLTLVENAIKHGIEPSLRGGAILVSALEEDSRTVIRVRDTGVGMSATPGDGAGLDNVRRRVALAYGDGAVLALYDADPGVVAEVVVPFTRATWQEAA
jgi:LytS/YehU family sensor histidine kinase